jgi:hypothetical protein
MSTTIKTGAVAYLAEYGEYVICDLYGLQGRAILKVTHTDEPYFKPPRAYVHIHIGRIIDRWTFPKDGREIIVGTDVYYAGYDGMPADEFKLRYMECDGPLLDH